MSRVSVFAVIVLIATMACSEPPDKERQQAEGAIAAARAADASTYAAGELAAAQAALDKYDAAVSERDYRQALALAVEARDSAYRAAKDASDGKATARSSAERLVNDLETLSSAAENRLAGASGPKLSAPAADHLRVSVKPATSLLQEARAQLEKQDYAGVISALTPIVGQLRAEIGSTGVSPAKKTH